MKKFISILLLFAMALPLCGCEGDTNEMPTDAEEVLPEETS